MVVPSRSRGHKKLTYVIYLIERLGWILQERIEFHNHFAGNPVRIYQLVE
jgi:hypothetical protein